MNTTATNTTAGSSHLKPHNHSSAPKKRSRKPPKPFSPEHGIFATSGPAMAKSHASGSAATAGKSCSQCGVTKTPQWREGPLGPKTLCNACGVKRVRQARAVLEGRIKKPSQATSSTDAAVSATLGGGTRKPALGTRRKPSARAAAFLLARPASPMMYEIIGDSGVAAFGLMSMSLPAEVVQRSINAQLEAHMRTREIRTSM